MSRLPVTLACAPYDRTLPLYDGRVKAAGIDLNVLLMRQEDVFWRMIRHCEFDASEMSLSSYLMLHATGQSPFIAIPVFPSRVFRHGSIYIRSDANITSPRELEGRAIGVPEYQMTAAVWGRGLLEDQYKVDPSHIRWFHGGLDEPGRIEKIPLHLPSRISLESIPNDRSLTECLISGELDGIMTARPPKMFIKGEPNIERLFPDYKEQSIAYYQLTHIFPPMHTVVLRRDLYSKHPWVAKNLFDAFAEALDLCSPGVAFHGHSSYALPFIEANLEEVYSVFGEDNPWQYGFSSNKAALERLIRHQYDHGLVDHVFDPEEAFASGTMDESRN